MALYAWQEKMKQWELNLDKKRYEILRDLKINDDKLDEIINVLKEYDVIMDRD